MRRFSIWKAGLFADHGVSLRLADISLGDPSCGRRSDYFRAGGEGDPPPEMQCKLQQLVVDGCPAMDRLSRHHSWVAYVTGTSPCSPELCRHSPPGAAHPEPTGERGLAGIIREGA